MHRFWQKVNFNGRRVREGMTQCWEWTAYKDPRWGYGIVHGGKKAHRIAWELHHGPIPTGMLVCHECDNPGCVNPSHLHLGTHATNCRERCERGRSNPQRGENQGLSRLKESDIRFVKAAVAAGESQRYLAGKLGVSPCTINDIVKGRTWRHV